MLHFPRCTVLEPASHNIVLRAGQARVSAGEQSRSRGLHCGTRLAAIQNALQSEPPRKAARLSEAAPGGAGEPVAQVPPPKKPHKKSQKVDPTEPIPIAKSHKKKVENKIGNLHRVKSELNAAGVTEMDTRIDGALTILQPLLSEITGLLMTNKKEHSDYKEAIKKLEDANSTVEHALSLASGMANGVNPKSKPKSKGSRSGTGA